MPSTYYESQILLLFKEAEGKVQSRELLCVSPSIQYSSGKKICTAKVQGSSDRSLHCLWEFNAKDLRALPPEEKEPSTEIEDYSASNAIIRELFHSYAEHESYMLEIQLRRIVDKMANG